MKYIVTGCDGKLGGRIAENMINRFSPSELIFTCPDIDRLNPQKKEKWLSSGIKVQNADYNDYDGMVNAFKGGDRILIVSGVLIGEKRVQQHKNAIDAAIAAKVKHITYISFLGASNPDYAHVYVTPDHTATEAYLNEVCIPAGVDFNIMRNNLYMENYLTTSVMLALISGNKWYTTAGEGRATYIAKDDSALAATALLSGAGEKNKAYNITGGESISQRDLCYLVSKESGIDIEYCPVNKEQFFTYLDSIGIPRDTDQDFSKSPVPWCGNDMVTNEASIAEGLMDIKSDDFEKLTHQKPRTAKELLTKYHYIWEEKISSWKDIK
ncbi:NmrA family NAD(P)-binding protein [Klebsiella oxytoca]|uniref:NmrA family NAD(P)-binding protein n=1 Tax=Klebsiella oxytoca TaxID=571 RepID=UPI003570E674